MEHPDLVLRFDLRLGGIAELTGDVSEAQRARARTLAGGSRGADVGRMLLIDDAATVSEHAPAIERVLDAESVDSVLLVLVGMPPMRQRRTNEEKKPSLPPLVTYTNLATLWIEDTRGVLWDMRRAHGSRLIIDPDGHDDRHSRSMPGDDRFNALLRALELPEVFDRVHTAITGMMARVASPGLRDITVETTPSSDVIVKAIQKAGELIGGDSANTVRGFDPAPTERLQNLRGGAELPNTGVLDSGSDFMKKVNDVYRDLDTVADITDNSKRWPCRVSIAEADRALDRAGEGLLQAAEQAREGLGRVDASGGLSPQAREAMRQFGVNKTPEVVVPELLPTGVSWEEAPEHVVRESGITLSRVNKSLSYAASQLRGVAGDARPRGPQDTEPMLDQARLNSAKVVEKAKNGARFCLELLGPGGGGILVAAGLVGFLASWWRPGRMVGIPLALLSVLFAGVILSSGSRVISPRALLAQVKEAAVELLTLVGATALGVVLALLLALLLPPLPARLWPVGVLSLLASVAVAVLLVRIVWRHRHKVWRRERRFEDMETELDRLGELVHDVAVNDWLLADARTRCRIVAEGMAASFEKVREILAKLREILADRPPMATGQQAAIQGDEFSLRLGLDAYTESIRDIVAEDLLEMTVSVVDKVSYETAVETDDAAVVETERGFTVALSSYLRGIQTDGVLAPTGNQGADERRDQLLRRLWSEAREVEVLLRVDAGAIFPQYCSPEALKLLSVAPESATLVRFAPAAAKHLLPRADREDAVPTSDGNVAGVLRLVPLREGAMSLDEPELEEVDQTPLPEESEV